jgi:hypothetical protein
MLLRGWSTGVPPPRWDQSRSFTAFQLRGMCVSIQFLKIPLLRGRCKERRRRVCTCVRVYVGTRKKFTTRSHRFSRINESVVLQAQAGVQSPPQIARICTDYSSVSIGFQSVEICGFVNVDRCSKTTTDCTDLHRLNCWTNHQQPQAICVFGFQSVEICVIVNVV